MSRDNVRENAAMVTATANCHPLASISSPSHNGLGIQDTKQQPVRIYEDSKVDPKLRRH